MFKQRSIKRPFAKLIIASAVVLAVAACGKKEVTSTQVVASVDGEEISVHQVNAMLGKARGVTPETLPLAKAEILGSLVDQQLAINMAMSKKLDRTPEIVAAIETAKREILARAALEQIASAQAKPTEEEAKKYYADNPALFSERRIYNLQEITLGKATPNLDQVRARVASAKSMEEIAAWLKERNINFAPNSGTRSAEQLPLEILPKLHAMQDGQIAFLESKDNFLVMRVAGSQQQPVSEAQALPAINVFLTNLRGGEAIKAAKAEMKAKAKIEYFGEFAGGEAAVKAKAQAEADAAAQAKAKAAEDAKASADAAAKLKAEEQAAAQAEQEARAKAREAARAQGGKAEQTNPNPANLEKGLKGLQ